MFPLFWRYFDDEDDAASSSLEYIPAPGSPSYKAPAQDSDSDNDPLDAYMANIEKQVIIFFSSIFHLMPV